LYEYKVRRKKRELETPFFEEPEGELFSNSCKPPKFSTNEKKGFFDEKTIFDVENGKFVIIS
jgi:hypothetical protein